MFGCCKITSPPNALSLLRDAAINALSELDCKFHNTLSTSQTHNYRFMPVANVILNKTIAHKI